MDPQWKYTFTQNLHQSLSFLKSGGALGHPTSRMPCLHSTLFNILRLNRKYFTYKDTSPLQMEGWEILSLRSAPTAFEHGGVYVKDF